MLKVSGELNDNKLAVVIVERQQLSWLGDCLSTAKKVGRKMNARRYQSRNFLVKVLFVLEFQLKGQV